MAPGRRRAGGELCAERPARASARARPEHLASIDLESTLERAPQAESRLFTTVGLTHLQERDRDKQGTGDFLVYSCTLR